MVRSINPVQVQFKHNEIQGLNKFHSHTEINKQNKGLFVCSISIYTIIIHRGINS